MRVASFVVVLVAAGGLAGCASMSSRMVARGALVDRAREGREGAPDREGARVVAFAEAQLGRPYCWGGGGPSCFDCSGLVQRSYASVGVRLPRTSTAMGAALPEVPLDEVRAGDILWWPGHVGIYAGEGWSIEALDSRHGVVRRPASNPYRVLRPPRVD